MGAALALTGLLVAPAAMESAPQDRGREPSRETRLVPHPVESRPRIDGDLDDPAWKHPPLDQPFITYDPGFGDVLPRRTRVWAAYDSDSLYFAFLCLDDDPERIKTSLCRRDGMFGDDWVGLKLDALGTRQSSYDLFCNPHGIQGDILTSAVSGEDTAPDFVWESAGRLTDRGYQVEMRIPLRSIRFKSGPVTRMRVLFWRRISRMGLSGSWPEIEPGRGIFNVTAEVEYRGLKTPLNLEVLPAAVMGNNRERLQPGEWSEGDGFRDVGIGLKYGLSSSVTADLTWNPDFSQVESDAFQVEVNRRYPIFYTEKRPFFMEGADIFSFFIMPYGYFQSPVHTRNIVNPRWGAKLTGTWGKTAFGVLATGDEWPGAAEGGEASPSSGRTAVFTIARAKHGLGGDSYVGALFSGREHAGGFNRTAGIDTSFRLGTRHQISFSVLQALSRDPGGEESDAAGDVNFSYAYHTRPLSIMAAYEHIGRDFRMDSAFLRRTGIDEGWIWIGPSFYPHGEKFAWIRRIHPHLTVQYLHDNVTGMDDAFVRGSLEFFLTRQGFLAVNLISMKESWKGVSFHNFEATVEGRIQPTKWLDLTGRFSSYQKIYYPADPPFRGRALDWSFSIGLQPTASLHQSFSYLSTGLNNPDDIPIYDVDILYSRTTYQFNKYFFLRGIVQYDSFEKNLLTDFLASFTFIPGTVLHLGYGGEFENRIWRDGRWIAREGDLGVVRQSFFFKASYLFRF